MTGSRERHTARGPFPSPSPLLQDRWHSQDYEGHLERLKALKDGQQRWTGTTDSSEPLAWSYRHLRSVSPKGQWLAEVRQKEVQRENERLAAKLEEIAKVDYSLASSPQGGLLAAPPLFRSTFIAAPPGYKLGPGHVPVLDHRNSHFPGSLRSKKTFTNMDDATLDNIAMHKRILAAVHAAEHTYRADGLPGSPTRPRTVHTADLYSSASLTSLAGNRRATTASNRRTRSPTRTNGERSHATLTTEASAPATAPTGEAAGGFANLGAYTVSAEVSLAQAPTATASYDGSKLPPMAGGVPRQAWGAPYEHVGSKPGSAGAPGYMRSTQTISAVPGVDPCEEEAMQMFLARTEQSSPTGRQRSPPRQEASRGPVSTEASMALPTRNRFSRTNAPGMEDSATALPSLSATAPADFIDTTKGRDASQLSPLEALAQARGIPLLLPAHLAARSPGPASPTAEGSLGPRSSSMRFAWLSARAPAAPADVTSPTKEGSQHATDGWGGPGASRQLSSAPARSTNRSPSPQRAGASAQQRGHTQHVVSRHGLQTQAGARTTQTAAAPHRPADRRPDVPPPLYGLDGTSPPTGEVSMVSVTSGSSTLPPVPSASRLGSHTDVHARGPKPVAAAVQRVKRDTSPAKPAQAPLAAKRKSVPAEVPHAAKGAAGAAQPAKAGAAHTGRAAAKAAPTLAATAAPAAAAAAEQAVDSPVQEQASAVPAAEPPSTALQAVEPAASQPDEPAAAAANDAAAEASAADAAEAAVGGGDPQPAAEQPPAEHTAEPCAAAAELDAPGAEQPGVAEAPVAEPVQPSCTAQQPEADGLQHTPAATVEPAEEAAGAADAAVTEPGAEAAPAAAAGEEQLAVEPVAEQPVCQSEQPAEAAAAADLQETAATELPTQQPKQEAQAAEQPADSQPAPDAVPSPPGETATAADASADSPAAQLPELQEAHPYAAQPAAAAPWLADTDDSMGFPAAVQRSAKSMGQLSHASQRSKAASRRKSVVLFSQMDGVDADPLSLLGEGLPAEQFLGPNKSGSLLEQAAPIVDPAAPSHIQEALMQQQDIFKRKRERKKSRLQADSRGTSLGGFPSMGEDDMDPSADAPHQHSASQQYSVPQQYGGPQMHGASPMAARRSRFGSAVSQSPSTYGAAPMQQDEDAAADIPAVAAVASQPEDSLAAALAVEPEPAQPPACELAEPAAAAEPSPQPEDAAAANAATAAGIPPAADDAPPAVDPEQPDSQQDAAAANADAAVSAAEPCESREPTASAPAADAEAAQPHGCEAAGEQASASHADSQTNAEPDSCFAVEAPAVSTEAADGTQTESPATAPTQPDASEPPLQQEPTCEAKGTVPLPEAEQQAESPHEQPSTQTGPDEQAACCAPDEAHADTAAEPEASPAEAEASPAADNTVCEQEPAVSSEQHAEAERESRTSPFAHAALTAPTSHEVTQAVETQETPAPAAEDHDHAPSPQEATTEPTEPQQGPADESTNIPTAAQEPESSPQADGAEASRPSPGAAERAQQPAAPAVVADAVDLEAAEALLGEETAKRGTREERTRLDGAYSQALTGFEDVLNEEDLADLAKGEPEAQAKEDVPIRTSGQKAAPLAARPSAQVADAPAAAQPLARQVSENSQTLSGFEDELENTKFVDEA